MCNLQQWQLMQAVALDKHLFRDEMVWGKRIGKVATQQVKSQVSKSLSWALNDKQLYYGNDSDIKLTRCSSRGPGINSKHPHGWSRTVYNSSSS